MCSVESFWRDFHGHASWCQGQADDFKSPDTGRIGPVDVRLFSVPIQTFKVEFERAVPPAGGFGGRDFDRDELTPAFVPAPGGNRRKRDVARIGRLWAGRFGLSGAAGNQGGYQQ